MSGGSIGACWVELAVTRPSDAKKRKDTDVR